MTDQSMPNQQTVPGQAASEAEKSLNQGRHYSGGSAMLSAEVEETNQMAPDAVADEPIATDNAGNTDTDDPTDAQSFTTTGAYPVDAERIEKDYGSPSYRSDQDTTK